MLKTQLLKQITDELARHDSVMRELKSKLRLIEIEEEAQRKKQYAAKKKRLQETGKVIKQYLNIGDIIQVTGSRSGKYRRIIALERSVVIGQVVGQVRDLKNPGNVIWKDYYNITEQGYDKITHVFKIGQFVKADEIVKSPA